MFELFQVGDGIGLPPVNRYAVAAYHGDRRVRPRRPASTVRRSPRFMRAVAGGRHPDRIYPGGGSAQRSNLRAQQCRRGSSTDNAALSVCPLLTR